MEGTHYMLRGIRRLSFAASAVALVAMSAPASAAAAGGGAGAVTGTVSGLTLSATCLPLCPQNRSFHSAVLLGAGAASDGTTGGTAAVINASANAAGASIAENVGGGVGTLTISAGGTVSGVGSVAITVNCGTGVYVRAAAIVVVAAACSGTVNGSATTGAVVVPVSVFVPNQTPPAETTSATFAGVWALAGV